MTTGASTHEIVGYSLPDMAIALDAMELSLKVGQKARLRLCTFAPPTEADLAEQYLNLVAGGIHVDYPIRTRTIKGVPTTDIIVAKGSPVLAMLIPLIIPVLTIGLIVFGITKIEDIGKVVIPALLITVSGGIVIAGLLARPAERVAELAIERGGMKFLPSTVASNKQKWVTILSSGETVLNIGSLVTQEEFNRENERVRKLGLRPATGQVWEDGKPKLLPQTVIPPELLEKVRELWNRACEWDKIPLDSKFVVFSDDNPFAKEYNEAAGELLRYRQFWTGEWQPAIIGEENLMPRTIRDEQLEGDREPIPFTPVKRLQRDDVLYVTEKDIPHPIAGYAEYHKEYSVIDLRGYRRGYEPRLEIQGVYTPNPKDTFRLQDGHLPPYQPTTTGDQLLSELRKRGLHQAFRIAEPAPEVTKETLVDIPYGTKASQLILKDKASVGEIEVRIEYYRKQEQNWLKAAREVAETEGGEEKYAFGMERAKELGEHVKTLEDLITPAIPKAPPVAPEVTPRIGTKATEVFPEGEYHLTPTNLGERTTLKASKPGEAIFEEEGELSAKWMVNIPSKQQTVEFLAQQKSVSFGKSIEGILESHPMNEGYIYKPVLTTVRRLDLSELDFADFERMGEVRYQGDVEAELVGKFKKVAGEYKFETLTPKIPKAPIEVSETAVGNVGIGDWVSFRPDGPLMTVEKVERNWVTLKDGQGNLQKILVSQHVYQPLKAIPKAEATSEKFLPALKPFDPYKFADYVLRNNVFSDADTFIYSGLSGTNPHRVPDQIWAESLAAMGGEFVKTGDLYVVHTPGVERPPDMRARPTWREVGPLMSTETEPSPRPHRDGDLEFLADSPEFLAQTIDMTGWRERIDQEFQAAIQRSRGTKG